MKRSIATICVLLAVPATALAEDTATSAPSHTTYYVSSVTGEDTAPGTSAETPWKTLERVQAAVLGPGDRVLFRGGELFPGTLALREVRGTAEAPIVLSSYGEGRATIEAGTSPTSERGTRTAATPAAVPRRKLLRVGAS